MSHAATLRTSTMSVCSKATILQSMVVLLVLGTPSSNAIANSDFQFESKAGRFGVSLPAIPSRHESSISRPDGWQVELYRFEVRQKDFILAIAYFDLPAVTPYNPTPEQLLEASRDGSLRRLKKHKLLREQRTNVQGYPALDYWVKIIGGPRLFSRVIIVDRRQYTLIIQYRGNSVPLRAKAALDSFRILYK